MGQEPLDRMVELARIVDHPKDIRFQSDFIRGPEQHYKNYIKSLSGIFEGGNSYNHWIDNILGNSAKIEMTNSTQARLLLQEEILEINNKLRKKPGGSYNLIKSFIYLEGSQRSDVDEMIKDQMSVINTYNPNGNKRIKIIASRIEALSLFHDEGIEFETRRFAKAYESKSGDGHLTNNDLIKKMERSALNPEKYKDFPLAASFLYFAYQTTKPNQSTANDNLMLQKVA